MDLFLLIEYGWVLIVLIALEGLLAADNALVLAIMVKRLPEKKRKKALFYGLAGAFVFRFASLFVISFLVDVWQVQAIGAIYLLFIAFNHIFRKVVFKKPSEKQEPKETLQNNKSGFWTTVLKVELVDIAFAVDSILAAFALAMALPETNLPPIGGMDGGQFLVILTGGFIGLVIMRFAATFFIKLLQQRPALEIAAFAIVGWVGIKLAVYTLAHPALGLLSEGFAKSPEWKATFYIMLVLIAVTGWFLSKPKEETEANSIT